MVTIKNGLIWLTVSRALLDVMGSLLGSKSNISQGKGNVLLILYQEEWHHEIVVNYRSPLFYHMIVFIIVIYFLI